MVRRIIEKDEIIRALSVIWKPLTNEQREQLIRNISTCYFKQNEIIYKEGDAPTHIMILIHGKVKIFKDGVGGRNQIVRIINEKGIFAYRAAFRNEPYITTASAFENSLIGMIPFDFFMRLIHENNYLAVNFIRELSELLGIADRRTVNLTQKHIRARLAESILWLKDKYGVEEDGSTLNIYLSREDLANLSNMTTSNAIRTLSVFAHEDIIAIDGRKIKIINNEELCEISRLG